jgi:hypothetical protein
MKKINHTIDVKISYEITSDLFLHIIRDHSLVKNDWTKEHRRTTFTFEFEDYYNFSWHFGHEGKKSVGEHFEDGLAFYIKKQL